MKRYIYLIGLLSMVTTSIDLCAEEPAQPVPIEHECNTSVDESWTAAEQFVWKQVCVGNIADFNRAEGVSDLDPRRQILPETRIIRSAFIETILLKDKYRRALTRRGVRIAGARFSDTLDLENAEIGHELHIEKSLLDKGANFVRVRSSRQISLNDSMIRGEVRMSWLRVADDLSMEGLAAFDGLNLAGSHISGQLALSSAELANVDLGYAQVSGQLSLYGARVAGTLIMNGLHVARDVFMNYMQVGQELYMAKARLLFQGDSSGVDLGGAYVGGQLVLSGAKISGRLTMNHLQVRQSVLAEGDDTKLADVDLSTAHIDGHLVLAEVNIRGELDLAAARIRGQLDLTGAKVGGPLRCLFIDIEGGAFLGGGADFAGPITFNTSKVGEMSLGGGTFRRPVDLAGIRISGALNLGSPPVRWQDASNLIVQNGKVGIIPNLSDAWPRSIDVNGLTYTGIRDIRAIDDDVIGIWFGKQTEYAYQPYEQLASLLQSYGETERATAVRYAGKDRERRESNGWRKVWLTTLCLMIGYGYHVERALFWVVGLIAIGVAFIFFSGEGRRNAISRFGVAFSVDMLLPIIRLRERHYQIDLRGPTRYYFYFHKVMGYVLASFLIAGLSGLTK